MAVEINIDLDSSKAHGKIEGLRTHLNSLNDDLDLDFDIDDDLKDKIQKLTEGLRDINIDVDYDDLKRAAALKAMLEGDIDTKLNVDSDKALREIQDGLDPPSVDHDEQARKFSSQNGEGQRIERIMKRFQRFTGQPRNSDGTFASPINRRDFIRKQRNGGFSGISVDLGELKTDIQKKSTIAGGLKTRLNDKGYDKIGDPLGLNDYDSTRLKRIQSIMRERKSMGRRQSPRSFNLNMGSLPSLGRDNYMTSPRDGKVLDGLKKKIKGVIPDMNTFYNILAVLIPILVVFLTQLLGVAAAMGAVAVAGAAVIGLGLVGHGEDLADSWEGAKEQLGDLRDRMFEVFQPTMQTFAPIQERFFDTMPEELNQVASSMESLTVYSDTLMQSLAGISSWFANGFRGMADMEEIISQLALRFGSITGSNLNDFFRFIVEEAYAAQSMLIKVGQAFKDLMVIAYQLFKVLVAVLFAFKPLISVLGVVADLLDNKLAVGILTLLAVMGATIYTVLALSNAFVTLSAVSISGLIPAILSLHGTLTMYIHQALATVMANHALAASIATVISVATLGIGAILGLAAAMSAVNGMSSVAEVKHQMNGAGGGIPSGAGAGTGGNSTQNIVNEGDTYNVEVNGPVDNATEQGLKDMYGTESYISGERDTPSVGGA